MKASNAFAAHRAVVFGDLSEKLAVEFTPAYNAEIEDIRRLFEETRSVAMAAPDDTARNKLIEVAERNKRARILDLNYRRKKFLESLNNLLRIEMATRVERYEGTITDEMETHGNREVSVKKAIFPDGSKATIPTKLFVNWDQFDRV